MKSLTALSIAATSSNGTSFLHPVASMSFAKRYGVEIAAQPAAMARVNAPDDLLRVAVRRQEDIGGVQQVGQLGNRKKAIVELDVIRDSEVDRATLEKEPILLTLEPPTSGAFSWR